MARLKLFIGLLVVGMLVIGLKLPAHATTIDVNLTFDLNNSVLGPGAVFPMSWSTGFISFPEVNPVAGDSLRISIAFVEQSSNRQQRLKVSDLGIGENVEGVRGRADGDPSLSVSTIHNNSFTFNNVRGDIFSNPVSTALTNSGGSGIGANAFPNMTDTEFSFTGMTWQVDFVTLTYFSGDGFNLTVFGVQGDNIVVQSPIPEPSTILLLASGLAGFGFFRRRRTHS